MRFALCPVLSALCALPYALCPMRFALCAMRYAPCSITRMVFHLPWEKRQKVKAANWQRKKTVQPQA
jgi:hypothetical protein